MGRTTGAQWAGPEVTALSRPPGEARFARAFAAARRHSRLVRLLRAALLLGAVGAVATLTALGLYRTFGSPLRHLSVGGVSLDGTQIVMDRPRLTGARPDGRPYVFSAAKAIQDVKQPTQVNLVDINGDIETADRDPLHLSAATGHYDTEHETLDLFGAVHLRNSQYTIDLQSVHVDMKTGTYNTQEPVTVVTNSGLSIAADSASMRDNGREASFEGRVKSVIRSNAAGPGAAEAIEGAKP